MFDLCATCLQPGTEPSATSKPARGFFFKKRAGLENPVVVNRLCTNRNGSMRACAFFVRACNDSLMRFAQPVMI